MARVTSSDVARASGVSRTTVSYVLNAREGALISEATRERVKATARALGYAPSAAARTLRAGRSDLVVCVLPDWPTGPMVDSVLDHLADALAARGLALLVHHAREERPLSDLWPVVTPRAVVGLSAFTPEEERVMRQAGIEVVVVLQEEDPHRPGALTASQGGVGGLQVQHLAAAGHRGIGYAYPTDPRLAGFADLRLAGVAQRCADLGLPAPLVQPVQLDVASAVRAVTTWRRANPVVTAVAAYNDEVALAVLAALRAEGLAVPGDVAVIGVDDIPAARLAAPALTTVSQSSEVQAGHLAAQVVDALDGGGNPPPSPGDVLGLVVRESA